MLLLTSNVILGKKDAWRDPARVSVAESASCFNV